MGTGAASMRGARAASGDWGVFLDADGQHVASSLPALLATLYSPLKLFAPVGFGFFALGAAYYAYTFTTQHRFTNMSALLFSASVIVFLIGLISEQITSLTYQAVRSERRAGDRPLQ
jgi:hypothetical protein